jgi:hypothetical protein
MSFFPVNTFVSLRLNSAYAMAQGEDLNGSQNRFNSRIVLFFSHYSVTGHELMAGGSGFVL